MLSLLFWLFKYFSINLAPCPAHAHNYNQEAGIKLSCLENLDGEMRSDDPIFLPLPHLICTIFMQIMIFCTLQNMKCFVYWKSASEHLNAVRQQATTKIELITYNVLNLMLNQVHTCILIYHFGCVILKIVGSKNQLGTLRSYCILCIQ